MPTYRVECQEYCRSDDNWTPRENMFFCDTIDAPTMRQAAIRCALKMNRDVGEDEAFEITVYTDWDSRTFSFRCSDMQKLQGRNRWHKP